MLHDHVGHRAVFPLEVFFKDILFCKWLTIGSVFKLLILYRQIGEVNSGQTIYPKIVSCDTEEGRSHIMIFVCRVFLKVFIPRLSLLCREKPVYHFINHKSHLGWPRIEPGSPW